MPGIFGIIGKTEQNFKEEELRVMMECMMYEPFFTSRIVMNEKLKAAIGVVNHQGSFSDCMPVWNETKEICLIFAGENLAEKSQVDFVKTKGHQVNAENAGYLVHLYEETGSGFLEKLNGWFGGVILDLRLGKGFLFNDRYGMHRIFVHQSTDSFYFASEAKALLAVLPDLRSFDPRGVGELLGYGCTFGNRTLYRDIMFLPPGALWEFEHGEIKRGGSYFDPEEWSGQEQLDEDQFYFEFLRSFGKAVKRHSSDDTLPVGVSLTGGLDSRMIMACLDQVPGRYPCHTFGSMYRDTYDVATARQVAKACGQKHYTFILDDKFLSEFPTYLEKAVYISDGYLGISGAAELYMNALAREVAPVRMTGNCGDELLRGYRAFKFKIPRGKILNSDFEPSVYEAGKTFQDFCNTNPRSFTAFRQVPAQYQGRLAVESSQVVIRTPFMDNDIVRLLHRAPEHLLNGEELSVAIISRHKPELLKIATDRGFLGDSSRLGGIIRRLERNALIKGEYWSSYGMPNWVAGLFGNGVKRFLEKAFLGRDKFYHFRLWSERYLSEYITESVVKGSKDLKEFIDSKRAEIVVREHVAGQRNYLNEIDNLLTLAVTNKMLLSWNPSLNEKRKEIPINLEAKRDKPISIHKKG